jgi:hypothetical protein
MRIDQIKGLAELMLQNALSRIHEAGTFTPMYNLVRRDGGIDVIGIEGKLMNSRAAKAEISGVIRQRAEASELEAVLFISDTFFGHVTNPDHQRMIETLRLDVEQAHALGLCEKHEAILVVIDTPIYQALIQQTYERNADKIVLKERRDTSAEPGAELSGRMVSYFDKPSASAAH